jgi:hypothetical protein
MKPAAAAAAMNTLVVEEESQELPGIEATLPERLAGPGATAVADHVQARIGARPLQLNLSEETYETLTQLKEILGAASRTEVVRLGLGVLAWVVEELSADHKIIVKRAKDDIVELAFPYLSIKKKARAV